MNEQEVQETEVETEGAVVVTEPPQSADQMRSIIEIGKIIDEYATHVQKIVSTAVKLTYDGDWTIHKKDGAADEDQKANMGAAAAERIANFIGISESNWTKGRKDWSDDNKHYTWTYEADFSLGKRKIHVISRVGTRDKFFGKAGGQWIPLEDVQEDNILKAAFRACRKEGVRTLLGLRNVPVSKLKELGFNVSKINNVGFEEKGKQIDKTNLKPNEKGLIEKTIQVVKLEKFEGVAKTTGKPWVRFDLTDKEGIKYAVFAGGDSKRIQVLAERQEDQKPVKIGFKVVPYNNRENYQIESVEGAEA